MRIKTFTHGTNSSLEYEVNEWIAENEWQIKVISTHFSTNGVNEPLYDTDVLGPTRTEYHAAIYYQEL